MTFSNLAEYVDQKNRFGRIFGYKPLSLDSAEDRQKIADSLDSDLSPENLCCDGELRGAALQRKAKALYRCVAELKKLDPNVKMYEAA